MPKPSKEQKSMENKRYMERVRNDPDRLKKFQATQRNLQSRYRKDNKGISFLKVKYDWFSFKDKYFFWNEEQMNVSSCSSKDFREWVQSQHPTTPADIEYMLEPDYETDTLERWVICNMTTVTVQ